MPCQLYCLAIDRLKKGERPDLMSFAGEVDIESVSPAFTTLLSRPQRLEKALPVAFESVKKIKERNWLKKREVIQKMMEDPNVSEQEQMVLGQTFTELTKNPPLVPPIQR